MKKYPKVRRPKSWIRAIDKLIDFYKTKPKRAHPKCPLCRVGVSIYTTDCKAKGRQIYERESACVHCPWQVFNNIWCDDMNFFRQQKLPARIKRLERWKKIIKVQLKGAKR